MPDAASSRSSKPRNTQERTGPEQHRPTGADGTRTQKNVLNFRINKWMPLSLEIHTKQKQTKKTQTALWKAGWRGRTPGLPAPARKRTREGTRPRACTVPRVCEGFPRALETASLQGHPKPRRRAGREPAGKGTGGRPTAGRTWAKAGATRSWPWRPSQEQGLAGDFQHAHRGKTALSPRRLATVPQNQMARGHTTRSRLRCLSLPPTA